MNLQELIDQVKGGDKQALPVYIELQKSIKEMEEAVSQIKDLAIDEANNYPEKSFRLGAAIVEKRSSPASWDYSHVNALVHAKNKVAYIQKMAQIGGGVDAETGEIIEKAFKIEGRANIALKFVE